MKTSKSIVLLLLFCSSNVNTMRILNRDWTWTNRNFNNIELDLSQISANPEAGKVSLDVDLKNLSKN